MVPACEADAQRVERGEDPEAREVTVGGERVPYWAAGPMYAPFMGGFFGAGILPGLMMGTMLGSVWDEPRRAASAAATSARGRRGLRRRRLRRRLRRLVEVLVGDQGEELGQVVGERDPLEHLAGLLGPAVLPHLVADLGVDRAPSPRRGPAARARG